MLVFSYAVELDAADPKADSYNDLVLEAARAYRTRAACFLAKGDSEAAQRDVKRTEKLLAKVRKADGKEKAAEAPATPSGRVTVRNDWTEPVTLVIAGVSSTLQAGETKTLATPAGSFSYEMQAGSQGSQGTMDAGGTYHIWQPPTSAP